MKHISIFAICLLTTFVIIEAKPWYGSDYDYDYGVNIDDRGNVNIYGNSYRNDVPEYGNRIGSGGGGMRFGGRNQGWNSGGGNRGRNGYGPRGGQGRPAPRQQSNNNGEDLYYHPRICRGCRINNLGNGEDNENTIVVRKA